MEVFLAIAKRDCRSPRPLAIETASFAIRAASLAIGTAVVEAIRRGAEPSHFRWQSKLSLDPRRMKFVYESSTWECRPTCDDGLYDIHCVDGGLVCIPC